MTVKKIIEMLKREVTGKKRKDVIDNLEEMLSENVKEISDNENFFNLSLEYLFSVFSKVNFSFIDESADGFEILLNFIRNTINAHKEKETLLLLHYIDNSELNLSYEKIISIFSLFTNCPILPQFCNLYNKKQQLPERDYGFELKQKDKEIEKLKQQINELHSQMNFQPIAEKPEDFESDIFKACKEGKLTSVRWLIEKENVDKNKKVEKNIIDFSENDTLIHIAAANNHIFICQYLLEQNNIDIDTKGCIERTPLHLACGIGHLAIVVYLTLKGANINAKDDDEWTPLHYASNNGHTEVVKYLVSIGANKNAKDKDGDTPYDFAVNDEIKNILS